MKPATLPTPCFYPLPDLAAIWGCSEALLSVYVDLGTSDGDKLSVTKCRIGKKSILGVTVEEKARFETGRVALVAPDKAINPTERTTYLLLIGALALTWVGEDPDVVDHPYKLLNMLLVDCVRGGIPVPRSDETNAKAIREGIEAACGAGYKRKSRGE